MKTIGVIGGIGPQATMDFELRLHRVAQKYIAPKANGGYPRLWVHYLRGAPVKLGPDGTPLVPRQPSEDFLSAARSLGSLCDFIVITSNSPHTFVDEVEKISGKKVVSMVEAVINEVKKRHPKKVGILGISGSLKGGLYEKPIKELNIQTETIPVEMMEKLDQAIFKVMEGREGNTEKEFAHECLAFLKDKKCDAIILGCTEIPFLVDLQNPLLINPIELLAEAAVKYAVHE